MRPMPLRMRLYLLAAAAILPLALASGAGLVLLLQQQRAQAERAELDLTRALTIAVDAELQRNVSALQVLATAPSLDHGDTALFRERAVRAQATQPAWLQVILSLPDGRAVVHTGYADGAVLPEVVESDSFARMVQSGKPLVGHLARGARGVYALPARVPVMRDGQLRYVLTAPIKPQAIADVLDRQRVPDDWLVSVFDDQGLRVARSRGADRFIGTPAAPELRRLLASDVYEGVGTSTTLEGEYTHTAFTRSRQTGWVVAIGIPPSAVYAGAYRSVSAYAAGLLLSLLLGVVATIVIARRIVAPIGALRDAARALGEGRLPEVAATDVPELQQVSDALAASAALQQNSAEERARLYAEAQAARQHAEAANRSKDEFLAMLGHELRNPLAPILTALRLMALRQPEAHQAERKVLDRQVAHLMRLVDDLLDVSRFARGKVQLQRELLDVRDVIARSLEMVQPLMDRRTTRVKVDLPAEPIYVSGDPVRLAQVIGNLLSNAAKFTPSDGRIGVRARADDTQVSVTVEDAGTGIGPDLLPRVFDLFVQGQQALDRQSGGLGLGLAIVKTLVELHGGSVEVASDGEGRGSRFTVRLPRAVAGTASSAPMPVAPTVPLVEVVARRIMLVDDNVDAADTLAQVLAAAGHQVRTAASAALALDLLDGFTPELAVLDIGLPIMNGYELAARLRADARLLQLKLVALTGYGHDADRARALAAGFDDHLVKPARIEQLDAVIARLFSA